MVRARFLPTADCRPPTADCPHHAIVAAGVDEAVVREEAVGDRVELRESFVVAVGDRLVRAVAAGHHEGDARVVQQEVMQGRVGEHHAESCLARARLLGDAGVRPPVEQDDRTRR